MAAGLAVTALESVVRHGAYFYYAHLSDYAKDFQIGEEVKAGTSAWVYGRYRV